jgi:cytoskeletal protein RodZ
MLEELCQTLKEKRKELGYDLEEAVERTKLHPSVIKAIESGNLKDISPVYIKGFINIYASFLGVRVGDDLDNVIPRKESNKVIRIRKPKDKKKLDFLKKISPEFRRNILIAIAGIAALIVLIIIFSSVVKFIKAKLTRPPEEKLITSVTSPASSNAPKLSVSSANQHQEAIAVSLKFKRDCFLRVRRDGKIIFEGVLKKGTLESWQANQELEFKISDGSSVDVEVNGKLLPPLSKIRKSIKSLKITTKGISIDK